jgi:hypothetical protein
MERERSRAAHTIDSSINSAAAAVFALTLAACAGSSGSSGTPDAGFGGPVCMPGSSFDLNGRFGVLAILSVHVNASGVFETDTTAELLLLLDADQQGRAIGVEAKVCDLKIPEVPISGQDLPIRFQLGEGLLDSVPQVVGSASTDGDETCSTFESEPITVIIGARLDPPDKGKLPEANSAGEFTQCLPAGSSCGSDAITNQCVCDQEKDGKPGATLYAMNVPAISIEKVYVNLRTTFTLVGQVFSSDDIQGNFNASLEQGILACSKVNGDDCSASEIGAVKNLNPDIQQNDEPSTFRALRVDDALDCATLIQMRDELFPR